MTKLKVIPDDVARRAVSRFYFEAPTGCHVSTYKTGSHGYPQLSGKVADKYQTFTAHRSAWVATYGQIPPDMTVDHMCKNKRCVNLSHLRLLTNFENARRGKDRDWTLGVCANGHPNSEMQYVSNGVGKPPKRACRVCRKEVHRINNAKQYAKQRARLIASRNAPIMAGETA